MTGTFCCTPFRQKKQSLSTSAVQPVGQHLSPPTQVVIVCVGSWHLPVLQVIPSWQRSPSLQAVPSGLRTTLQTSCCSSHSAGEHGSVDGQVRLTPPVHWPPMHAVPTVQNLPPSQAIPSVPGISVALHVPLASQAPVAHSGAMPSVHAPPWFIGMIWQPTFCTQKPVPQTVVNGGSLHLLEPV